MLQWKATHSRTYKEQESNFIYIYTNARGVEMGWIKEEVKKEMNMIKTYCTKILTELIKNEKK